MLVRAKTMCHKETALQTLSGSQFRQHAVAITGHLVELPHPKVREPVYKLASSSPQAVPVV